MMFFTHIKQLLNMTKLTLVITLLVLAGCKLPSPKNRNQHFNRFSSSTIETKSSPTSETRLMPDVTNTDVDGTGRKLQSAGLTVRVKRQKTLAESHDRKIIVLPEIIRSFQPSTWSHMIAAQEPAEGTPVHPGSVVTLIAGIHHGAGPFKPWLKAHGSAVNRRGDVRCRDCHTQTYCSGCHSTRENNPGSK